MGCKVRKCQGKAALKSQGISVELAAGNPEYGMTDDLEVKGLLG